MKKYIFTLAIICTLFSCERYTQREIPSTNTEGIYIDKMGATREFEYKNHSYILFTYGHTRYDHQYHIVHNPDCECVKQK